MHEAAETFDVQSAKEHSAAILGLINGILHKIKSILCDAEKLSTRYGLSLREQDANAENVRFVLALVKG